VEGDLLKVWTSLRMSLRLEDIIDGGGKFFEKHIS